MGLGFRPRDALSRRRVVRPPPLTPTVPSWQRPCWLPRLWGWQRPLPRHKRQRALSAVAALCSGGALTRLSSVTAAPLPSQEDSVQQGPFSRQDDGCEASDSAHSVAAHHKPRFCARTCSNYPSTQGTCTGGLTDSNRHATQDVKHHMEPNRNESIEPTWT